MRRADSPPGGYTSLYNGASDLPRKTRRARAMPSMQRRSYLEASENELSERRFRNRTRACLQVLLFSIAVDDMSIS